MGDKKRREKVRKMQGDLPLDVFGEVVIASEDIDLNADRITATMATKLGRSKVTLGKVFLLQDAPETAKLASQCSDPIPPDGLNSPVVFELGQASALGFVFYIPPYSSKRFCIVWIRSSWLEIVMRQTIDKLVRQLLAPLVELRLNSHFGECYSEKNLEAIEASRSQNGSAFPI